MPKARETSPDEAGNKIKTKRVNPFSRLISVEVSGIGLVLVFDSNR